ncbi:MAG: DUF1731 domain-containing protein [Phycisphaeraceae bacterium]|nr:DUF1731 domain-containing protein [Phycisphaeraceae bacterium]MCW5762999.1 DUF1731 domain-containing protein [Phycisphaeraceae bacterium]
MSNRHIVIAGGSGFLGVSLATHLRAMGREVVIVSRSRPAGAFAHESWDGATVGSWARVLDGAAGLVNLAGRSVDCVKTPDHVDEILRSRVMSTQALGEACRRVEVPPRVWVQMSTAHIYGDPPTAVCDEDSAPGYGLAPFVGGAWEAAFEQARLPEQRAVVLRTGFVLGRDRGAGGGALARLRGVARLGLGGRVGSGTQGMSWIHELDMNRVFERALDDDSMQGMYIASGPNPTAQAEFMRTLRRVMNMPIGLPATALMVRLGAAVVLRTDPELALYGRYLAPRRLLNEGFEFRFGELEAALRDLLA